MNDTQQQAHKLFSQILLMSREYETITLEDQVFPSGTGPFLSKGEEQVINLSGTCGLLGYGHPVNLKAKLFNLLDSESSKSGESVQSLMSDWDDFISERIGIRVSLSPFCKTSQGIITNTPGRSSAFLDKAAIGLLKSHNSLTLFNFLSFPTEIILGKAKTPFTISSAVFHELKLVLKFLRDGGFYGADGHVELKANLIKETFKECQGASLFEGLTFSLNQLSSQRVTLSKEQAIFPLSFDKEMLQIIKDSFSLEKP